MLPQTKSMYNIREEHLALIREIEEGGGELTPELEQSLALTQEDFQDKAVSYGFVVKSFEDIEETLDKEINRLQALKVKAVKRAETFKSRLDDAMRQFGVEKISTPTLTLSYRKSSPLTLADGFEDTILKYAKVSVVWDEEKLKEITDDDRNLIEGSDADLLDLIDVSAKVSKSLVTAALKGGSTIPGAAIGEKKNLQIK